MNNAALRQLEGIPRLRFASLGMTGFYSFLSKQAMKAKYEVLKRSAINGEATEYETNRWADVLCFVSQAPGTDGASNLHVRFKDDRHDDMNADELYKIMIHCERKHVRHVTLKNLEEYNGDIAEES